MRSTTTTHVWAGQWEVAEVLSGNLACSMQTKGFEPSPFCIFQVAEQINFLVYKFNKIIQRTCQIAELRRN